MTIFLIALGGFLGANTRYMIGLVAKRYLKTRIPLSTLLINALGSYLLGVLAGQGIEGEKYSFFGVGFMGAFTTFSTFKIELVKLWESTKKKEFFLYFLLSYIFCIFFSILGYLYT